MIPKEKAQFIMTKLWQMMQSDTKIFNSDKDIDEFVEQDEIERMERVDQDENILDAR